MNTPLSFLAGVAVALILPTMASAQQCPSYASPGNPLSYTSDDAWTPRGHAVVAGGDIDLGACASVPGFGYVIASPDFTLTYDDQGRGRALEFRVSAGCDTVLLVNAADGQWFFNDDDNGLNPRIRLNAAPGGRYDIWIGTVSPSTCDAQFTIESF